MAGVLQAIALISEPPGSYLYQVLLLWVLAAIAIRSAAVGARRLALAFCGLAGLRLGALVISLLTRDLPIYQLVIIPPFDRAITWLTIFGLIWAFTYPHAGRLSGGLAAAAVLLTSAAVVASWMIWVDAVGQGSVFYNGTLQDSLWLIAQLFLLAAGMFVLLRQRAAAWQPGLVLLAVLFVSEVLHYLFPIADANVPGFVRVAELFVWPAALMVLWRRPLSAPAPLVKALASEDQPAPAKSIGVEILEAELDAANRRNQQLRETNRQTRQQLVEAAASLAESQARLAEVMQHREQELARQASPAPDESSQQAPAALAREELAQERAAREQAEVAAQTLAARVALMEAALSAATDQASESARAVGEDEELNTVRLMAQSQARQLASFGEQLAGAQAQQQEQAEARQAVESLLAEAQVNARALTEQLAQAGLSTNEQAAQLRAELAAIESRLAQKTRAEAELRVELRDSQTALSEARRAGDQAQAHLSEQAIQIGVLKQQVAQLERQASERSGQVDRRRSADSTAVNRESPASKGSNWPKNGGGGRDPVGTPSGNGQKANGAVEYPSRGPANPLAAELRPELTPTIAGPVCAHLGLQSDHATRHAFPSEANRCFGLAAPMELSFEQQRRFCLSGAHVSCPIFTGQLTNPSIPIDTSPGAASGHSVGQRPGAPHGTIFPAATVTSFRATDN